jgi:hypothetical protein
MNPLKYKSISMRKNAWDIVTALADKMLPYGKMSRSQIVEIAINRLHHQMYKGEVSLDTYIKPKKLHFIKKKLPEPAHVGTAETKEEFDARNKAIYHNRIVAKKLTLQQLGTMYNITRERVRQIEERIKFEISLNPDEAQSYLALHEVSIKKLNQQQVSKEKTNADSN